MLIAAFEVHVRRPASARRSAAAPPRGSSPSRTRRRGCRARARTTCRRTTGRRGRRAGTPRSAARTRRRRRSCSNTSPPASTSRRRQQRLAAGRAVHGGNRHAPRALARDAPVGPVRHHVEDAVAAPGRNPFHLVVDRVLRGLRAASASGRPRRRSPGRRPCRTNHCDVARKITGLWQRQQCGYWCANVCAVPEPRRARAAPPRPSGWRRTRACPANRLDRVEEVAARPDRRVDLEAVLHAGQEVVGAVARRGVHRAGALLERDVVGQHADRIAVVERMPERRCLRAARPSSARPAIERAADRLRPRARASPSATITARPSTS